MKLCYFIGRLFVIVSPRQIQFKTGDGYMIVGAGNDGQWRKLCDAMGVAAMAFKPEYLAMKDRNANRAQLAAELEAILTTQTTAFWLEKFGSLGIPHAPINTYDQVFAHPQVQHRELRLDMQRPAAQGGGNVARVRSPIRMSDTPVSYRHAPPVKGSSTVDVLREILGKSDAEIEALKSVTGL